MKKILKSVLSLIITASIIGITNVSAYAIDSKSENGTKIKLYETYVELPYDSDEIIVNYNESEKEVQAIIKDKKTGKVIEVFGEEIPESNKTILTRGYYKSTVYRQTSRGPAVARLYAVLDCYSSTSFRQINRVDNTYWSEASSGNWVLERDASYGYVSDANSSGVGTKAAIAGTANIVVTTTSNTTGSFSINALKSAGYTVSHSSGSTYYARTPISFSYTYSLYPN